MEEIGMTGGEIAFLVLVLAGFGVFMSLMAWRTFNPEGGKIKRTADQPGGAQEKTAAHA
jgi:hypothetical protein